MSRHRHATIATLTRPSGAALRIDVRSGTRPDGYTWAKIRLHVVRADGAILRSLDLRPYEAQAIGALTSGTSAGLLERYADELAEADHDDDADDAPHAAQERSTASASTPRSPLAADALTGLQAARTTGGE